MKFGKINNFMLFGGGQMAAELALKIAEKNPIIVITSKRHSEEKVAIKSKTFTFKQFLCSEKINYFVSKDINSDKAVIEKIKNDTLGISVGSAWIFRKKIINYFNGRLVNIHGTKLPMDRGGAIFSWQILRHSHIGFALIHQVDEGIDTGVIIKYKEFLYPHSCRKPEDYYAVYSKHNVDLVLEFLEDVKKEKIFNPIQQQEYFSTYWPRLATEIHGYIDWSWKLNDIESFILAFDKPYKGASTFINSKKVFLRNAFSDFADGCFHPFQKGIIYRKSKNALFVATENGTLVVKDVKGSKGEDIIVEIKEGDRFYTPIEFLERAKLSRVFYSAGGLTK